MSEVINNDFHPIDQGLNATEDHWGSKLSDMVSRGRTMQERDQDDSRKAAIKGGGYDSTGTFKGTK